MASTDDLPYSLLNLVNEWFDEWMKDMATTLPSAISRNWRYHKTKLFDVSCQLSGSPEEILALKKVLDSLIHSSTNSSLPVTINNKVLSVSLTEIHESSRERHQTLVFNLDRKSIISRFLLPVSKAVRECNVMKMEQTILSFLDDKDDLYSTRIKEVSSSLTSILSYAGHEVTKEDIDESLLSNSPERIPPEQLKLLSKKEQSDGKLLGIVALLLHLFRKAKQGRVPDPFEKAQFILVFKSERLYRMTRAVELAFGLHPELMNLVKVFIFDISEISHEEHKTSTDFTNWLKSFLITRSVDDDEGDAVPKVNEEKVQTLFDTCLRFSMLEVSSSRKTTLQVGNIHKYVFLQYNMGRLAVILDKFEKDYGQEYKDALNNITPEEASTYLIGDLEWQLILRHIIPYDDDYKFQWLLESENPTRLRSVIVDIIRFTQSLAKDFSILYSSSRILPHINKPDVKVVASRVFLAKKIYDTLSDCLSILGLSAISRRM